jgi:hypothetical protein
MQFNVSAFKGTRVLGSELNMDEVYAPSCNARLAEAWWSYGVSSSTTWNNMPGVVTGSALDSSNTADGYNSSCGANNIGFNVQKAIADSIGIGNQDAASFLLKATDEGDKYAWKKFDATTAKLTIKYNRLPNAPTGLTSETKACSTVPNQVYLPTVTPTLTATVSDPDSDPVQAQFEYKLYNKDTRGTPVTGFVSSGKQLSTQIPAGTFASGDTVSWHVRAGDNVSWGPWSVWCDVTLDTTHPAMAQVTSPQYPDRTIPGNETKGMKDGTPGTFTFKATDSDVVGFLWRPTINDAVNYVSASNLSATVTYTPNTGYGPRTLRVRAVDRAGNASTDLNIYKFWVSQNDPPSGSWAMQGYGSATTVLDNHPQSSGTSNGAPLTLTAGSSWVAGRNGDAVHFDGAAGSAVAATSVLDTSASFSVQAWAKIDAADTAARTIISQDGTNTTGFGLQYRGDSKKWVFLLPQSDVVNPATDQAQGSAPVVGQWTHLVGVYDASARKISLYVNGKLAASVAHATGWKSTGSLAVGRGRWNGNSADFFNGSVEEVAVYPRVLAADEISGSANAPVERAAWHFGEGSGTVSADVSGNGHTLSVASSGVTWISNVGNAQGTAEAADNLTGYAAHFDGSGAAVTTSEPVIDTSVSFTISALVKVDSLSSTTQTFVSQAGTTSSGFFLKYMGDQKKWAFATEATDGTNPSASTAIAVAVADADGKAVNDDPVAGTWASIAGAYDAISGQLSIYVNGHLSGVATAPANWKANGVVQIGRSRFNGVNADFVTGSIDDVHLYSGVMSVLDVTSEQAAPSVIAHAHDDGAYVGIIARYVNHDGQHVTTSTGVVPADYHLDKQLGLPAIDGATGTTTLYTCRNGVQYYSSSDKTCGGATFIDTLGAVYSTQPTGVNTIGLYSCKTSAGVSFDSSDSACEGGTQSSVLGYARADSSLIRYQTQVNVTPMDDWSTTTGAPPPYVVHTQLGYLAMKASSDGTTQALYGCVKGADHFTSTKSDCEGATVLTTLGYLWASNAQDGSAQPLYRCITTTNGEHFDSLDQDCAGQTVDSTIAQPLGYIPAITDVNVYGSSS